MLRCIPNAEESDIGIVVSCIVWLVGNPTGVNLVAFAASNIDFIDAILLRRPTM